MASTLFSCLCGGDDLPTTTQHPTAGIVNEKPSLQPLLASPDTEATAARIISILIHAEKPGISLKNQLDDAVTTTGWTEWLAENILHKLEDVLKAGHDKMGPALAHAYDTAVEVAKEEFSGLWEYAKEHPLEIAAAVVISILAMGVLAELTPFVLEALGFAEMGPIEGSFAAWWQRTYGGYVPKGSLFSFFQRLGATWRRG